MRQLDLEGEVVDRFEAEGREGGVDRCGVALRIHQRDALAVENGIREQRLVVGGEPRIDQPLPRVDKVLRFDRRPVPVLRRASKVKHIGGARVVAFVALRRRGHETGQVGGRLQQGFGDRAEHGGLV